MQAAVLQVKFKAFKDYELTDINKAAMAYTERLHDIVKTPIIPDGFLSSWAQYTIRLKNRQQRDALQAFLKSEGVPSMVYYPKPMHLQTAYAFLNYAESTNPVTINLCDTVLSLPIHPYITVDEIDTVSKLIRKFISQE